ncbi:SGT1 and CS domain-containing protein [Blastomyces dermatitidis ATCC 18188]|uniref:SGT1 and CS domain-containing protein n=1 Tax=Ajellomyces dermatitidis (strain ATCC 18188 / CBS 674.68) TaxID=653446 RepID=F2TII5_AJEDA|nr:SGT1 and CS domain-containing protein [Blastomyces dermatitidis ATCC 18188]
MDEAQRGAKALAASNFPAAIELYTRALIVNPHATDYYIKRSTAYSRLRAEDGGPNGQAALHDSEMAVALALQRARREQILAGQIRRAIVLYQLGRYGDAHFVFEVVRSKIGPSVSNTMESAMAANSGGGATSARTTSKELDIWEIKVGNWMRKLEKGDERLQVTVKEYPDIKVPEEAKLKEVFRKQLEGGAGMSTGTMDANKGSIDSSKGVSGLGNLAPSSTPVPKQPSTAPPPQAPITTKVRHEWYQTHDTVVITLYAKGVPKEQADVDIQEDSLSVTFPTVSGSDYSFNLYPLFSPVDSTSSKATVMSTKIEIILRKKQPGQKWGGLEGTSRQGSNVTTSSTITPTAIVAPRPNTVTSSTDQIPSYPTSSRTGPKDWDKVASSLTKKKKKKESKDKENESLAADKDAKESVDDEDEGAESDNSDYGSGDPVDSFFKKLYAKADPDTRRAMVKSYYESEGTALSTNWSEVGKGKVEVKPPSDD